MYPGVKEERISVSNRTIILSDRFEILHDFLYY